MHENICNCKECVWNRILKYCSSTEVHPQSENLRFKTYNGIEFGLNKLDNNTIKPYNKKGSKLWKISFNIIAKDIELNRGGGKCSPNDFGSPAPSYRYALLNDDKIWLS